jgi:uncharacterized protein YjbJ (UPF0337 family)
MNDNDVTSGGTADDVRGKAKETVGKATDDSELERQGRADQAKADLKDAAQSVKDAAGSVKDSFTN